MPGVMVAPEHVLPELERLITLTAALRGDHFDKREYPAAEFAEELLVLLLQTKRLLSRFEHDQSKGQD